MGQANNNWKWLSDAGKWVGGKLEEFTGWVGGLGQKFNEPERQAALEDQKDLMSTQLGLNMQAAEHGQRLQKDMIEYTSPAMQMQRLKDAGLNPALMYGGAGGGVSGQSAGSQSTSGVSGGSSDAAGRMMAKNQQLAMGLQLAKLRSEVDVNKSVAAVNKANADKTAGADTNLVNQSIDESKNRINNIIQDTKNKRIQSKLMEVQTDYQEIVNSFQGQLTETQINNMISNINYMNQDTERLMLNNEITSKSKEELIKNNILQNANLGVEILKKNKEIEGIDAKINEIEANIKLMKSATNLNDAKTAGEKIMNAINDVERINTEGSGMTKESGLLGPVINGMRAGVTAIGKLFN